MTTQPSPHALILEIEQALHKSQSPEVKRLGGSMEVLDFLDTQRMKMEQGNWSGLGYKIDRIKLQSCKAWRQSPEIAREQVGASLVNLGLRIQMADEMTNFLVQLNEVGRLITSKIPHGIRDFAKKIAQRREETVGADVHTPGRPTL